MHCIYISTTLENHLYVSAISSNSGYSLYAFQIALCLLDVEEFILGTHLIEYTLSLNQFMLFVATAF